MTFVAPLSALVYFSLCALPARLAAADLDSLGESGDSVMTVSGDGGWLGGFFLDPDFIPHPLLFHGGLRRLLDITGEIRALSADGSVAAGFDLGRNGAFRYDAVHGVEALPMLRGGDWARAEGISATGRFIVGSAVDGLRGGRPVAVLWDGMAAPESFRPLETADWSTARGVDRTGRFVGGTFGKGDVRRGFRYDRQEGSLLELGSFGGAETTVNGISADGETLVGQSRDAEGIDHAFRFRATSGLFERLGQLPGAERAPSTAQAVNGDGSVVVGTTEDAEARATGFRFSDRTGLQSIEQWLRDGGATLADGWTADARAVSEDGNTVTGQLRDGRIYIARRSTAPPAAGEESTSGPSTEKSAPENDTDFALAETLVQGLADLPGPRLGLALVQRRIAETETTLPDDRPAAPGPSSAASVPLGCAEQAAARGLGDGDLFFSAGGGRLTSGSADVEGCETAIAFRLPLSPGQALHAGLYLGEGRYRYERPSGSLIGAETVSGRSAMRSLGLALRLETLIATAPSGFSASLDTGLDLASSHTGRSVERGAALQAGLAEGDHRAGRLALGLTLRQSVTQGLALRLHPAVALPFSDGSETRATVTGLGTLAFAPPPTEAEPSLVVALDLDQGPGHGTLALSLAGSTADPGLRFDWQQSF